MIDETILYRLSNALKPFEGEDIKVFIFGSQATGKAKATSDIDIGVESKNPLSASLWFDIQESLDTSTSYTIDLVDFSKAPEDFKKEAKKIIISLI